MLGLGFKCKEHPSRHEGLGCLFELWDLPSVFVARGSELRNLKP